MKILKKLPLVLSLMVLILSFTACKKSAPDKTVPAKVEKKTETVETKKVVETIKPATGKISDDLYKYEVLINDVAYTLPTSFSTFEKSGWVGENFTTNKLDPNQYNTEYLKNGEESLTIDIANFGLDVLPMSECQVGGIKVDSFDKTQVKNISIAKGITIGSTYDDVIAAYGKSSDEYKSDMSIKLTYESGSYSKYDISFDSKTKKVTDIDIQNLTPPTKSNTTSVDTEVPAVIKNYKAPSSVGTDLLSFQVKYGGSFYKLPIPIPELIKNGWVLQTKSDEVVPAKSSAVGIELRKDNQVLRTQIENYSDKGEPLKNCFATYIEYYNNGAVIPIELPKGITEKSTIAQVIAAYGKPTEEDSSASFKYYTYGKIFEQVTFMTKDGKIEKIEVNYAPKELK